MLRRPFGLGALGVLLLGVLGFLWVFSSSSFLVSPDPAKPLADRVKVEGERRADDGGIYYVDVLLRRASWLDIAAALTWSPDVLFTRRPALRPVAH